MNADTQLPTLQEEAGEVQDWLNSLKIVGADVPIASIRRLAEAQQREPEPVPMIMTCPSCSARHIDEGDFAHKPHHTHACQNCGMVWRPAKVTTVGVQFLPGYKG